MVPIKNRTKNAILTVLYTKIYISKRCFRFFFPCWSVFLWILSRLGEMARDVNSRTHASVSSTFYTIIYTFFYNTVFLAMIVRRKMFVHVWASTTTINIAQCVLEFTSLVTRGPNHSFASPQQIFSTYT